MKKLFVEQNGNCIEITLSTCPNLMLLYTIRDSKRLMGSMGCLDPDNNKIENDRIERLIRMDYFL